ncbi:VIER F-box protein 2 [Tanacetum coccineum]
MCKAFKEFNYLLQIDPDLLTKDIIGFKTYEDYKDDWIYEWNKDVPWVDEKPWTNAGVWTKPAPVKHTCKPFNYKTGCSEWPTCSWMDDRYCNGRNLPRTYIIENQLHYQDYEWYEALEDCELKDEALRNKAIMEGFIKEDDDESCNEQKRRWNIYTNYDDAYEINHEDNESKELCEVHELPVCNIRKYMMIKYSFNNDDEYVAVKQDEYDDLTITRKEACRAYQEIFRIMDEEWMFWDDWEVDRYWNANLGLSSIPVPNLIVGYDDVRLWRDSQGNLKPFSVACAWDSVRLRADVVDWYHLVWFPQCIPRHAFHLWLVAKQKLKTQDRLRQWDVSPSVVSGSWSRWYGSNPPRFADISTYLIPSSKGTSVVSIISRLLLGAVSYYIWSERNSRLFKKKASTVPQIVQVITSMVRLKLVTFKFKKVSTRSRFYSINERFQVVVWFTKGVPGKGCTLFSFSKVFPIGFFLGRFFKEAALSGLPAPFVLLLEG